MKRLFDILFAAGGLVALLPLLAGVALMVKLTSRGPVLYWSERVGRDNRRFRMPKFRTMRPGAPEVEARLIAEDARWLTPVGGFLRRTSLDEWPQLWSVLRGDMSLVGPRPVIPAEADLVELRARLGVHRLRPGLTGWAQINGRAELGVEEKAALDAEYLSRRGMVFDLRILLATVPKVLRREGVEAGGR
ncbi:MAG: sugar transferase [Akkermansiaceae bacterium]|nr:sugar transferase [Akkermansiaceae bacterium]